MNQTAPEDTPPLPPPGKLLASAEIISLADHAAKRAAKLGTVIDGLEAGIASRGEDAAKSAAAAGFPPEDQASAARTPPQRSLCWVRHDAGCRDGGGPVSSRR